MNLSINKILILLCASNLIIFPFYKIFNFSIFIFCLILSGILSIFYRYKIDKHTLNIVIIYVLLAFYLNIFYFYDHSFKVYLIPIVCLFAVKFLFRTINELTFFFVIIVFCQLLSSVVTILQFLDFNFFWNLRLSFMSEIINVEDLIKNKSDYPGLSLYSVQMSYQQCFTLGFLFFLFKQNQYKLFCIITFGFMLSASIITRSDSSTFILLLFLFHYLSGKKYFLRNILYISTIILFYNFFYLFGEDKSSRILFLFVGFLILFHFPMGIKSSRDEAIQTILDKYNFLIDLGNTSYLFEYSFHNTYLNFALDYGVIPFLLIILITIYIFLIVKFYQFQIPKYLKISFLALLLNSLVHNAGIGNGDIYTVLIISMIIGLNYNEIEKKFS